MAGGFGGGGLDFSAFGPIGGGISSVAGFLDNLRAMEGLGALSGVCENKEVTITLPDGSLKTIVTCFPPIQLSLGGRDDAGNPFPGAVLLGPISGDDAPGVIEALDLISDFGTQAAGGVFAGGPTGGFGSFAGPLAIEEILSDFGPLTERKGFLEGFALPAVELFGAALGGPLGLAQEFVRESGQEFEDLPLSETLGSGQLDPLLAAVAAGTPGGAQLLTPEQLRLGVTSLINFLRPKPIERVGALDSITNDLISTVHELTNDPVLGQAFLDASDIPFHDIGGALSVNPTQLEIKPGEFKEVPGVAEGSIAFDPLATVKAFGGLDLADFPGQGFSVIAPGTTVDDPFFGETFLPVLDLINTLRGVGLGEGGVPSTTFQDFFSDFEPEFTHGGFAGVEDRDTGEVLLTENRDNRFNLFSPSGELLFNFDSPIDQPFAAGPENDFFEELTTVLASELGPDILAELNITNPGSLGALAELFTGARVGFESLVDAVDLVEGTKVFNAFSDGGTSGLLKSPFNRFFEQEGAFIPDPSTGSGFKEDEEGNKIRSILPPNVPGATPTDFKRGLKELDDLAVAAGFDRFDPFSQEQSLSNFLEGADLGPANKLTGPVNLFDAILLRVGARQFGLTDAQALNVMFGTVPDPAFRGQDVTSVFAPGQVRPDEFQTGTDPFNPNLPPVGPPPVVDPPPVDPPVVPPVDPPVVPPVDPPVVPPVVPPIEPPGGDPTVPPTTNPPPTNPPPGGNIPGGDTTVPFRDTVGVPDGTGGIIQTTIEAALEILKDKIGKSTPIDQQIKQIILDELRRIINQSPNPADVTKAGSALNSAVALLEDIGDPVPPPGSSGSDPTNPDDPGSTTDPDPDPDPGADPGGIGAVLGGIFGPIKDFVLDQLSTNGGDIAAALLLAGLTFGTSSDSDDISSGNALDVDLLRQTAALQPGPSAATAILADMFGLPRPPGTENLQVPEALQEFLDTPRIDPSIPADTQAIIDTIPALLGGAVENIEGLFPALQDIVDTGGLDVFEAAAQRAFGHEFLPAAAERFPALGFGSGAQAITEQGARDIATEFSLAAADRQLQGLGLAPGVFSLPTVLSTETASGLQNLGQGQEVLNRLGSLGGSQFTNLAQLNALSSGLGIPFQQEVPNFSGGTGSILSDLSGPLTSILGPAFQSIIDQIGG